MTKEKTYDADSIRVLEGLEAVRLRPGMYIGSTGPDGLHHLIYEVLDNSIDEAIGGHCDEITVTLHEDNAVTVEDNGRGIPVDLHPTEKVSALQVVMTKLHAGGKFDEKTYPISGGLHGVGVSVVNALSKLLFATIYRGGFTHSQRYEKGIPKTPVIQKLPTKKRGTLIKFYPDPEIFPLIKFDPELIAQKLKEVSFLNPGVKFIFDAPGAIRKEFLSSKGIAEYVKEIVKNPILPEPIYFKEAKDRIQVEVALTWGSADTDQTVSFCNNIRTNEGGTHLVGFKTGLTLAVNKFILTEAFLKRTKTVPVSDDIKEGLVAIISVKVPQPQFEGQTKTRLGTAEVKGIAIAIVNERCGTFFHENPALAEKIAKRIMDTARGREAAQHARDNYKKAAAITSDAMLPGKLSDCQIQDPARREIFVVEGDSAGGTAKQGRDRKFQAILPIKGKILNIERATMGKLLANTEVQSIIAALGTNLGKEFDIGKLRYHKIILLADSDTDGSHIRTLLMTFFFRQMPELIMKGHLYVGQPPLFKVKNRTRAEFALDEKHLEKIKASFPGKAEITRYKGLGEMPPQTLWETTMDPERRSLRKVFVKDAVEADNVFNLLMGNEPSLRANFIAENALKASLDI